MRILNIFKKKGKTPISTKTIKFECPNCKAVNSLKNRDTPLANMETFEFLLLFSLHLLTLTFGELYTKLHQKATLKTLYTRGGFVIIKVHI